MPSTDDYVDLVTNQHRDKPNFVAAIRALTQGFIDNLIGLLALPPAFDLDTAVGVQLDAVGLWVGITRRVSVPITGVYFSFDDAALGFDIGVWYGGGDPSEGLVDLDDFTYRLLLRAKIGANRWDGTKPSLLAIISSVFTGDQETSSRASQATYFDAAGIMRIALSNVIRMTYDITDLMLPPTLLLEAGARNYLLKSRKLDNPAWTPSRYTITPDYDFGIDAVQLADLLTCASFPANIHQSATIPANTQVTFSFYAKILTPSPNLNMWIEQTSPAGGSAVTAVSAAVGVWQRHSISMTTGMVGPVTVRCRLQMLSVGKQVLFDAFQLEIGPVATSFIETDAVQVDRAPDIVYPPGTGGPLIFVEDRQDMTMTVGLAGVKPNPLQLSLLTRGLLVPKPEGVKVNYAITTVDGAPIFGFDSHNNYISGFDAGAWSTSI